MKAHRLFNKNGDWVGVKWTVEEFWEIGSDEWVFTPLDFDPEKSETLTKLPKGIAGLPRRRIRIKE